MESRKCRIEDKEYDSGAEVCDDKLCYVCKTDGSWLTKGALDFLVGGP